MIATSDGKYGAAGAASRGWRVARWSVWTQPQHVIGPVLTVELAAVALTAVQAARLPDLSSRDLLALGLLTVLGVAHTEVAVNVERVRRRISPIDHHDLSSVWTFAGVVVLPGPLAVVIALIIHSHLWLRAWRLRVPLYRHVFTTSTIVLACIAGSATIRFVKDGSGALSGNLDLFAICLGVVVFATVNSALVAGAIAVSTPNVRASQLIGAWDQNLLEIATLCLGAIAGVALIVNPWLVLLVLPPLLVLHRAVLVRQLEEAASTDGKTGLLNAAAWHAQAERALRRTRSNAGLRGVLVLDLDHFKAVNDSHGHIAGDHVLAAVADTVRAEVRERDLVGRFGGEEFVVMLAGLEGGGVAELEAVAERIRQRVADLRVEIPTPDGPLTITGLTVSVGAAVSPADEAELRALLQIADTALYAAKRAGRNMVRMGRTLPVPHAPVASESAEPPSATG
jgi:diguanylate cyclase (GGDEF)-like protein